MRTDKKKGIIYLAFGYEYLLMAAHSARSAKLHNPDLVLELITNVRYDNEAIRSDYVFDSVTVLGLNSNENRYVKTNIVDYTGLEYGVYVDCDTEIRGNLDPIFECLDRFDLAIKHCSKPTRKEYEVAPGISSKLFPEWNGGVVFFRNNGKTKQLFHEWSAIFRRQGMNRDQPALAQAIYQSDWGGRLLSLNAIWNTFRADVRLLQHGEADSRIWHYRKAEEWPSVAPAILRAHHVFRPVVGEANPSMVAEIEEVGRRYRFLNSRLYRLACSHPRLRRGTVRVMKRLMEIRLVTPFNLDRSDTVVGESYRRIGREEIPVKG